MAGNAPAHQLTPQEKAGRLGQEGICFARLLGIEFRHLLLFILVRRRPRSKLLGAGLQMADRRATRHGGRGAREWFGIDGCVARDQDAADGCCDEKH